MMLSIRQLFRFVLIALFLFAFQVTALHTSHAFSEVSKSCEVCEVSKHLDGGDHHTQVDLVLETAPYEVEVCEEQQRIALAPYALRQTPSIPRHLFSGLRHYTIASIPLGYDAHAPPVLFS